MERGFGFPGVFSLHSLSDKLPVSPHLGGAEALLGLRGDGGSCFSASQ